MIKRQKANYTFKLAQSLSLDEKTLFKTPKMKYAPCPSLCSHVPRQTYKQHASYLFMCPIAVLIVTLGLFSSGLNTYGGNTSSSSTMGSVSVSPASTDFEHLFLRILTFQEQNMMRDVSFKTYYDKFNKNRHIPLTTYLLNCFVCLKIFFKTFNFVCIS